MDKPLEKKFILRNIFHCWTVPVLLRGIKNGFEKESIYVPLSEQSGTLGETLSSHWRKEVRTEKPLLMRTILRMFGSEFLKSSLLLLFQQTILRVSLPILMGLLIRFLEGGSRVPRDGYILASIFIFAIFFSSLIFHTGIFQLQRTGMRIRVALTNLLYTKVLRLSGKSLSSTGVGELTNLLSNDLNRFDDCLEYLPFVLIGPLQVLLVIGVLWIYTGPACFPGLAILIILLPTQGFLGHAFGKLRMQVAEITDQRVRQVTELLHGILLIKMSAWETNFQERVTGIRREELKAIQKNNCLSGLNLSLLEVSTRLSVLFTLFTFVMTTDRGLTTEIVFVTLCMYNTMSLSVGAFLPSGVSGLSELWVSLRRIQRILLLTEKVDTITLSVDKLSSSSALQIQNLCCSWGNEKETLKNITFSAKAGDVLGIVGPVGCGKSSLLVGILGELLAEDIKSVIVNGSVAYASQEPWLFPGSIRENIILGLPWDETWYEQVLEACALKKDINNFPYGDDTLVGDEGMTLSGGQKTRINLARAVYSRADIFLFDDTLSSLDVQVARHVVEKCIGGLLREKCVILVTHGKTHLHELATEVLSMENGSITCRGSYETVFGISKSESGNEEDGLDNLTMDDIKLDETENEVKKFKHSLHTITAEMKPTAEKELQRSGSVGWKLFITYVRAGNATFGLLLLLVLILMTQVVLNGSDLWLKNWTEKEKSFRNIAAEEYKYSILNPLKLPRHLEFVLWYAGLVVLVFVCCFARVQGIFCALLSAGKTLHENLFEAILMAPMNFFERNPPGLLLKLFSNDVGVMDERLPSLFFRVIGTALQVVGSFVVICLMEKLLIIPAAIFLLVAFVIQKKYILASSELKRLEGVARSPILGHLKTTLGGLPTIRALGAEKHFYSEFTQKQDAQSSIFLLYLASFRWLTLTLELLTNTFIGVVMTFLVATSTDGSTFGLALTAALSILNEGTGVVMFSTRCINHVLSVERILDYSDVEPEELPQKPVTKSLDVDWPSSGEILFSDVCLSYKDGPTILKDINLHIHHGDKIGVIGRTGAGKSSLVASLFRIIQPQMGDIEIDGLNTNELRLKALRLKISIIPQNPILLAGTLRQNLDPFSEFLDNEIWEVLEVVQLKKRMMEEGAGLDFEISVGGVNLSQGERQLISLGRTLLRKNKIIVLDEATANIDTETDSIIQAALTERFTEATVITIAHRLQTIMDADRILVLDDGKIKEFDKPIVLLQNENSFFYKLLQKAGRGHGEKLRELAARGQTAKCYVKTESEEEDIITKL